MSGAEYRLLPGGGGQQESGRGDVEVSEKAFVLTPDGGAILRVPFGQIRAVSEPEPFTIRVDLTDGTVIELSRLGVMRTQILAELADRRGDTAASQAAAVGDAERFSASRAGTPVELRVHEDALLIIGPAGAERLSFSFIGSVTSAGHAIRIEMAGRPDIGLDGLGRRTGEFAGLVSERITGARGRTAAFLESLLPGLTAMELRGAAARLRDGVAVPVAELDAIHPELAVSLTQFATLPQRSAAIAELGRRTGLAIGFRQVRSVRREAEGAQAWHDHAVSPHIGEHESPGGSFAPGLAGMMAAGLMAGGPPLGGMGFGGGPAGGFGGGLAGGFGGALGGGGAPWAGNWGGGWDGGYWAFRALGAGMNQDSQRPMTSRPDVTRGRLTPATQDLDALVATGADPTVMAFALGFAPGRVVLEFLNLPGPPTFVYRTAIAGPEALAAINQALDGVGFQVGQVHATGPGQRRFPPGGDADLLAGALAGRIEHDAGWSQNLARLLGGEHE